MNRRMIGLLALLALGSCGPSEPEIHTCFVQEDCPESQDCLQGICESAQLPWVTIEHPEDGLIYPWNGDGTTHPQLLRVKAHNLTLRAEDEYGERIVGEGYLVVFVDEVEVATIEAGNLEDGIDMNISFDDTPGVHRIRVQARLNDGTDYDHERGSSRKLVWVDDGLDHVAVREPWPGDAFSNQTQLTLAEVAVLSHGAITIGPSSSAPQHVHILYDSEPVDMCLMDPLCFNDYKADVPDNEHENGLGALFLPDSAGGTATLTAVVVNDYHDLYSYTDEMGMQQFVYSSIQIVRDGDVETPPEP